MEKKILIILTAIIMMCMTSGCDVSDDYKEEMYNAILYSDTLNLDKKFNEYDEIKQVDNSPIPKTTTYYIYKGTNDEEYFFEFQYGGSNKYDSIYWTKVRVESGNSDRVGDVAPPVESISYVYTFEQNKKDLSLDEAKLDSYYRHASDEDCKALGGLKTFSTYEGEARFYFDQRSIDERIRQYLTDYAEGKNTDLDVIIKTDQGSFPSDEITFVQIREGRDCELKTNVEYEGKPVGVQIGDVLIPFQ